MEAFYEGALTAGSVFAGFIGTFLSFRIQREANYYRQPVPGCDGKKDVYLGLSQFPVSLLLILLGAVCALIWGVCFPLLALAHQFVVSPATVLAGLAACVCFVFSYFVAELFHYEIICKVNKNDWAKEGWIAWSGTSMAIIVALITYCALRHLYAEQLRYLLIALKIALAVAGCYTGFQSARYWHKSSK